MEGNIINTSSVVEKENSISRLIALTIKKRTGKGPEIIKTVLDNESIVVTVQGLMTKMEENFIEQVEEGAHKIIENVRLKMIDSFTKYYTNAVNEIINKETDIIDVQWNATNNTCIVKFKILS